MAKAGFFKKLFGELSILGFKTVVENVKEAVSDTIEQTEKKIEIVVKKVVKTTLIFLIMIIGFIFVLVGLGKYLSETFPQFSHGLGFAVVGLVLIIIGWISRALSN